VISRSDGKEMGLNEIKQKHDEVIEKLEEAKYGDITALEEASLLTLETVEETDKLIKDLRSEKGVLKRIVSGFMIYFAKRYRTGMIEVDAKIRKLRKEYCAF